MTDGQVCDKSVLKTQLAEAQRKIAELESTARERQHALRNTLQNALSFLQLRGGHNRSLSNVDYEACCRYLRGVIEIQEMVENASESFGSEPSIDMTNLLEKLLESSDYPYSTEPTGDPHYSTPLIALTTCQVIIEILKYCETSQGQVVSKVRWLPLKDRLAIEVITGATELTENQTTTAAQTGSLALAEVLCENRLGAPLHQQSQPGGSVVSFTSPLYAK